MFSIHCQNSFCMRFCGKFQEKNQKIITKRNFLNFQTTKNEVFTTNILDVLVVRSNNIELNKCFFLIKEKTEFSNFKNRFA